MIWFYTQCILMVRCVPNPLAYPKCQNSAPQLGALAGGWWVVGGGVPVPPAPRDTHARTHARTHAPPTHPPARIAPSLRPLASLAWREGRMWGARHSVERRYFD